ncbi:MAG: ATP-binding cassette domain-containing protein [Nitriliruptorales bacterium]|nr:ATP-binding cassette domain-containing protein [Nitriliruptorales bacterium]
MPTSVLPALRLDEVTVRFGGLVAVDSISMEIAPGQRWAVIGPNGAGKTTLFRTVSGEQIPTSGSVALFDEDITQKPPHKRAHRGIGRTYQITNLFLELTVEDNVMIAAQGLSRSRYVSWLPVRHKGPFREQVHWALEQVKLSDKRTTLVNEMSHGEQRQLELAMGLASKPRLLLLDEPAAGLSASERVLMRRLIEELPRDLTLVLIEHDMELALEVVEWVLVLDNGKMIASGPPDEIRQNETVHAVYLKSD